MKLFYRSVIQVALLPASIFGLLLISCSKAPVANFSTDKNEYEVGETIHLTNTSDKARSYLWSGTGITDPITTKDAEIVTNSTGIYSVTLTAWSKGKKRSSIYSLGIKVSNPSGTITFYNTNPANSYIEIYDGDQNIGYLNGSITSTPACGINNYSSVCTATLDAGPHQFRFFINGSYNYVNDTVILNSCRLHQIN